MLVCPRREVKCFIDLTADEVCDLWLTAKEVGGRLERHHEASSLTFAIQVRLLEFILVTVFCYVISLYLINEKVLSTI